MNDVKIMYFEHFKNIIKDKITLNKHSINVTGITEVHNFERTGTGIGDGDFPIMSQSKQLLSTFIL